MGLVLLKSLPTTSEPVGLENTKQEKLHQDQESVGKKIQIFIYLFIYFTALTTKLSWLLVLLFEALLSAFAFYELRNMLTLW